MRALCRTGVNEVPVQDVADPAILNRQDAVVEVTAAGIFGYSHAMGGFAGSHAEYVRVPYADVNVPKNAPDSSPVFASDAVPTGWMGADLGGVGPGDGAQTLDYQQVDVLDALKELTGGRGPDVCIEFKNKKDGCVRAVFRPGTIRDARMAGHSARPVLHGAATHDLLIVSG
ncbi:hypothetical protein [Nonomuraea jabiensis]|uniref:hypothetical protein n=1 Tax=Nonomuraea jabiensis TaxID=882448 RepID=UPI003D73B170